MPRVNSHAVLDEIADELSGLLTAPSISNAARQLQFSGHSTPEHHSTPPADWDITAGGRVPGEEVRIIFPLHAFGSDAQSPSPSLNFARP